MFESSLGVLPEKYQNNFPEVGFLFCKLAQLTKKYKAVSKRLKDSFEEEEKKYEVIRMRKTNVEIDRISSNLEKGLEVNAREEKEKRMGKDIAIARAAFSEWQHFSRGENKFSGLRMLKDNLINEFFQICDLELYEIGRDILKCK